MSNLRLFEPSISDSFESMFKRFLAPTWFESDLSPLEMRVDVAEKNGTYMVHANLPGVKKEDINVRVDGNLVQIDAEVKKEKDIKDEGTKLLRSERYYGSISRSFTVSQEVDDTNAKATYENGVLTLELPKKTTTTSKQLMIQ
jgi:HSP20 family protein